MKTLGNYGTVLLAMGLGLFGLMLRFSSLPTYKGAPGIFMLLPCILLYFFVGVVLSAHHASISWKSLKVLSLLPLAITLGFTFMTLSVPRTIFPPRNARFFEEHSREYDSLIESFTRDDLRSRRNGDYALPNKFKHLSDDEKIRVVSKDRKINYCFLYEKVFMGHHSVVYAPDGLILSYEYNEPIIGHPGWYRAGNY